MPLFRDRVERCRGQCARERAGPSASCSRRDRAGCPLPVRGRAGALIRIDAGSWRRSCQLPPRVPLLDEDARLPEYVRALMDIPAQRSAPVAAPARPSVDLAMVARIERAHPAAPAGAGRHPRRRRPRRAGHRRGGRGRDLGARQPVGRRPAWPPTGCSTTSTATRTPTAPSAARAPGPDGVEPARAQALCERLPVLLLRDLPPAAGRGAGRLRRRGSRSWRRSTVRLASSAVVAGPAARCRGPLEEAARQHRRLDEALTSAGLEPGPSGIRCGCCWPHRPRSPTWRDACCNRFVAVRRTYRELALIYPLHPEVGRRRRFLRVHVGGVVVPVGDRGDLSATRARNDRDSVVVGLDGGAGWRGTTPTNSKRLRPGWTFVLQPIFALAGAADLMASLEAREHRCRSR